MTRGTFFFVTIVVSGIVGYLAGQAGSQSYLYANSSAIANGSIRIIDFTVPSVQTLADDKFAVTQLSQEEHLTGIKFRGRMINLTAVDFEGVTFELSVSGENKEFTISRISSGDSTGFEVYVPELSAMHAKTGQILYRGGMVRYLAT